MTMLKNVGVWSIGLIFTLALLSCGDNSEPNRFNKGVVIVQGPAGSAGPPGSNGATGPQGSAGPGVTWTQVTGAAQQAAPNTGYLANNASEVVVSLPASSSLAVGDIVQVSGIGAGGWKITQNAGQSITFAKEIFGPLGPPWIPRDSARDWLAVASSDDGTKLVAVAYGGGQIYTSTDSGISWTPRESNRNWQAVASSADGTKRVAVDRNGQIYTSVQRTATTAGSPGFIRGDQNKDVAVQYIGNDVFTVVSHEGSLTVN